MSGYFTAGVLLCLIGEPAEYKNCMLYRSTLAYPTETSCYEALQNQLGLMYVMFDMEAYEIREVKCVGWLSTPKKPNL